MIRHYFFFDSNDVPKTCAHVKHKTSFEGRFMPEAYKIAGDLLPLFGENVVARRPPLTYGQYAAALGMPAKKYGLAVGQAMHAIGAACVVQKVPVAPLFWVRRSDNEDRAIFENDPTEFLYVITSDNYDTMYVVAREYHYKPEEFIKLEKTLKRMLAKGSLENWSPHKVWHETFRVKRKDSEHTYFECAMLHYRALFSEIKAERAIRR
jgi:hypothetical protein